MRRHVCALKATTRCRTPKRLRRAMRAPIDQVPTCINVAQVMGSAIRPRVLLNSYRVHLSSRVVNAGWRKAYAGLWSLGPFRASDVRVVKRERPFEDKKTAGGICVPPGRCFANGDLWRSITPSIKSCVDELAFPGLFLSACHGCHWEWTNDQC